MFRIPLLHSLKTWLLTMVLGVVLSPTLKAQSASNPSVASYDPIVATLDSLVNQCFIQRVTENIPAPDAGMAQEIPSYSDDIYLARMQRISSPIPFTYNDQVKQYIDLYGVRRRQIMERTLGLGQLYFPLFEQVLDQQGLPMELKYLSIVESALNPVALSPAGASGLWQFILSTGKMYGLKVDSYVDERRDPEAATYAACKYFKDMYAVYGDWLLVIASYNCGPGGVNRAIARSGGKRTFWEICPYLPAETRGYVPAFIAVTYLASYASEHNLTAVAPLINWFEVDTVQVNYRVDLHNVAEVVGVSYDVISYLNPVYKKGIVPNSETPQTIRLPLQTVARYLAAEDRLIKSTVVFEQPVASSTDAVGGDSKAVYKTELVRRFHRVKRGEQLGTIARRYGCTVTQLKKWNGLRTTRLMAGQNLKVFVSVTKKVEVKETTAAVNSRTNDSSPAKSTEGSTVCDSTPGSNSSATMTVKVPDEKQSLYHVVAPGDTLWKIAQRYEGLTIEKIKEINQLNSNELKVGTKLKVTLGS
ncbi:MAG: LysM peptidoglycan-binding domain-containing protein [Bacteroidota bacterium]